MEQLVGKTCPFCGTRIGSNLDGDLCAGCGQASHFVCRATPSADHVDLCPQCGGSQKAVADAPAKTPLTVDGHDLELWNPRAAALWSLLFSQLFGAWIHAANWKVLKNPGLQRANYVFMALVAVIAVLSPGFALLPQSKLSEAITSSLGPALIAGWYFSLGVRQDYYVRETLGNAYAPKSWVVPLLCASLALMVYGLYVFALLEVLGDNT